MKYAEVAENIGRLVDEMPPQDEFIFELLLKKKLWLKNVAQAARLQSVPQASSLPSEPECPQDAGDTEPTDNEQAGRLLYDPDKRPVGLRFAHHQLDLAVDRLYRAKPFTSDEERLEHLFKLYEEMVKKEQLV